MAGVLPSGAVSQHAAGGPLPDGSVEVITGGGGGGGDTTAPTWPVGAAISLVSGTVTSSGFQLDVTPATDNVAVTGYRWSTNGGSTWLADWPSPNYTFTGLAPSTPYSIAVQARDAAGNYSSSLTFSQSTGAASVPGFNLNSAAYAIKQWETGALRASGTVTLRVRDNSTGAHVCTISGLAISGGGLITTFATHASLALATTYEVVFDDGAGNLAVARLTTTAS